MHERTNANRRVNRACEDMTDTLRAFLRSETGCKSSLAKQSCFLSKVSSFVRIKSISFIQKKRLLL